MTRKINRAHVVRVKKTHVDRQGNRRVYESVLLRRTYRDGSKVRNQTLANLSMLPNAAIAALEASLKGHTLVPASGEFTVLRALPHGHVAAVEAMARHRGLPALLGPPCRSRDVVWGLIISQVIDPTSQVPTLPRWGDSTLAVDLNVADASANEVSTAMDWLLARQHTVESKLVAKQTDTESTPQHTAFLNLTSCRVSDRRDDPIDSEYFPTRRKRPARIEFGVATDRAGCPLAVRVFPDETGDTMAATDAAESIRTRSGLERLVLVGDRSMINSTCIDALRGTNDTEAGFGWITALRPRALADLAGEDGRLRIGLLSDVRDVVEITHPAYPGERLIASRDAVLAAEQTRKRDQLLAAAETLLASTATRVKRGELSGADSINRAVEAVLRKYQLSKHFRCVVTDVDFSYERNHAGISAYAAFDGISVLRTNVPATELDAASVVSAYRNLARVGRNSRNITTDDLDPPPIDHRHVRTAKAHALIRLLACHLSWHLHRVWAPLIGIDEHPSERFDDLLRHLATLTRNTIRYNDSTIEFDTLTEPTPKQHRAFELIDAAIPLTIPKSQAPTGDRQSKRRSGTRQG